MSGYVVAVAGGTGAVGREILNTLERRDFPVRELRILASARSAGSSIEFKGEKVVVEDLEKAQFQGVDFVLSSPGGAVSKIHSPRMAEQGAVVIDNTSAFRMDPTVPLVVPEVNPEAALTHQGIIANPNCSTIQMVVALNPLHRAAGIKRVVVSTYQSVSGAGQTGIWELWNGVKARVAGESEPEPSTFPHPIAFEVIPQIDKFDPSGYTKEELKMVYETRKIMGIETMDVSATCVRVPVMRGHSESITVDFDRPLSAKQAQEILGAAPGVTLADSPEESVYPLARHAEGTDTTWVGRIRQDISRPQTLHMWVVSDNLLKGAALNAVQIAELLIKR
ncbi:aspartate-semialdehyde dehydrogenase [Microvenator marinus]|uniref:Aspartate-semialdehyde dehydrogenase n=1 Tax=Microvenator marinus TaxID=2600177 RepID=A0A5B8XTV3_9DELT|nr:aspartate-semialdehyde dehydrogenase [Microvenator marinus]QED28557.1 aspartate-semialdehyde dehydrogenase [Microvenator marinus]